MAFSMVFFFHYYYITKLVLSFSWILITRCKLNHINEGFGIEVLKFSR